MDTLDTSLRNGVLEQRQIEELLEAEVTAGSGTAEQKSWSLSRPVTLIGSSRHAHIRIEEPGIEPVHAALLNTGDALVLTDLNSRQGVFCGGHKIKTVAMGHSESFRLGMCLLHVHFTAPREVTFTGDSVLSLPNRVTLEPTRGLSGQWNAQTIGTVIGSREGCDIRLDSHDVLPQLAILSRVASQVVLASLAADRSIRINTGAFSASVLQDGDVLTVWPIVLRVRLDDGKFSQPFDLSDEQTAPLQELPAMNSISQTPPVSPIDPAPETAQPNEQSPAQMSPVTSTATLQPATAKNMPIPPKPVGDISLVSSRLAQLEEQLLTSSRQLQQWQEQLEQYAAGLVHRDAALSGRQQQLDDIQKDLEQKQAGFEVRQRQFQIAQATFDQNQSRMNDQATLLQAKEKMLIKQAAGTEQETTRLQELARTLESRIQAIKEQEASLACRSEIFDRFGKLLTETSEQYAGLDGRVVR